MINEEQKFYKETLLSDIKECMFCIFEDNKWYCDNHMDGYNPCEYANDEFKGMTMTEVKDKIDRKRKENYENQAKLREKRKAEKEKREIEAEKRAKRRRETQWENRDLDEELKQLKKSIKVKKEFIFKIDSFARAFSYANNTLYGTPKLDETKREKHPYEYDIERMEQRIEEIQVEKKERAKVRRVRRKLEEQNNKEGV